MPLTTSAITSTSRRTRLSPNVSRSQTNLLRSFDYFGFKTLERSYLLKVNGAIGERPQQMYMRVAVGIHKGDIDAAIETYELMSQRFFTHATPTLFNGGTPRPQLSSCFLLTMKVSNTRSL